MYFVGAGLGFFIFGELYGVSRMQMERERRNNGGIGEYYHGNSLLMESSSKAFPISSSSSSPSSSSLIGGASGGGVNYIEHPVSKFDTLAGVAIKYGVEVNSSCLLMPFYFYLILFCVHFLLIQFLLMILTLERDILHYIVATFFVFI